jgi:hypothetical protein
MLQAWALPFNGTDWQNERRLELELVKTRATEHRNRVTQELDRRRLQVPGILAAIAQSKSERMADLESRTDQKNTLLNRLQPGDFEARVARVQAQYNEEVAEIKADAARADRRAPRRLNAARCGDRGRGE